MYICISVWNVVKTQLNLSKNTNENDKANAANMRKQSVQLIIPNVTYVYSYTHAYMYSIYAIYIKCKSPTTKRVRDKWRKNKTTDTKLYIKNKYTYVSMYVYLWKANSTETTTPTTRTRDIQYLRDNTIYPDHNLFTIPKSESNVLAKHIEK